MGTAERKERERKQRAEQIISAAEKVFFAKGFDNSTMDDVAACAELSKGALYKYFNSKNELCIGIVGKSLAAISEAFEQVMEQGGMSGREMLRTAGLELLKFSRQHPKHYCAMLNYRHHRGGCGSGSSYLRITLEENREINRQIAVMLETGIKDGSLRADIDPETTATALWGDLGGLIPGFILSDMEMDTDKAFKTALDIIIKGLKN